MRLPGPLRAAVGLVASATDEAKHLPDRAIELPMLAVSTALQMSLRAQQRYARLAARGDAVLNRRPPSEDPPPWATFDDPVSIEELHRSARNGTDEISAESSKLLEDIFGVADPATPAESPASDTVPKVTARKRPAKKAAKKTTSGAATKPAAKKTGPAAAAGPAANGKGVSKPRHIAPSAFDNAPDDD